MSTSDTHTTYLLFHTLVELFSVVIGCAVFTIAWNCRRFFQNAALLLLSIACLFVAGLDLVHALAYRGMHLLATEGANVPTQLWIAARYLESLSFLAAPLLLKRRLKAGWVMAAYAVISASLLLSILAWRWFPACYVDGAGLTLFKRLSEYLICAILAGAGTLLFWRRAAFDRQVLRWLLGSLATTVASELAFTLYVDVYGPVNLLGHCLKVVSFYCLYRAIIQTGLTHPFSMLLRETQQSERQLSLAMDAGQLAPWEMDLLTGKIKHSPRLFELFGLVPDQSFNSREQWRTLIHEEDRAAFRQSVEAAQAGKAQHLEYRVHHPDGRIRWHETHGIPVPDSDGRYSRLVGYARDITERKEFEAELERLVSERTGRLQELVSELEHFSYSITHDMRAPLRAMQGFAEMFAEACNGCPQQDGHRFLKRIRTSATRMDALIVDALNYSKAVRQDLVLAPVDVGALLRGMLDTYPEFQASRAHIEIEGEVPPVLANEAGLTQCFSNLLGNAVKFTKPGQIPQIRVRAEVLDGATGAAPRISGLPGRPLGPTPEPGPKWVRIWVEDDGLGIPKPMLPRVFDMFARGHKDHEGTGIGLALVRKVMDRMGGRVGVESQEGTGSRFWLDLKPASLRCGL